MLELDVGKIAVDENVDGVVHVELAAVFGKRSDASNVVFDAGSRDGTGVVVLHLHAPICVVKELAHACAARVVYSSVRLCVQAFFCSFYGIFLLALRLRLC